MPELLEIEMYRRAAGAIVGRTIEAVDAPDDWFLKGVDEPTLAGRLTGTVVQSVERLGKLMILETPVGAVGVRFGMTGRLIIDGAATIEQLEYSSARLDASWNRFALRFTNGGSFVVNDARRLGGIELEPDMARLGVDAWLISEAQLASLFARYRVGTKALLLNQARVAGLGNLLVDELLWRAGVAPDRAVNDIDADEVKVLAHALGPMLEELYARGGSHRGDLFEERNPDGHCPRDGVALAHAQFGGRSTWWCPEHQR